MTFSDKPNLRGIYYQKTCFALNVKRSSSERRKMRWLRYLDLYKERKFVREIINKGKMIYFIFKLIDLTDNNLLRIIRATMYSVIIAY